MPNSRIEAARRGENPTVVCRMPSGWVVLHDWQHLPGYCLLLADPEVPDLNSLSGEERSTFLRDMGIIGDVLLEVTDSFRINYSILGNLLPILHAHVCPRYHWEDPVLLKGPTAHYDRTKGQMFDLELHGDLMQQIRQAIEARLSTA